MKKIMYLILVLLFAISCTGCRITLNFRTAPPENEPENTPEVDTYDTKDNQIINESLEEELRFSGESVRTDAVIISGENVKTDEAKISGEINSDNKEPSPSNTPVVTTTKSNNTESTVSNNPNSFADKGRWSTTDNPIAFGDAGNVNMHNSVLFNLDGSDAVVQLRLVGRLTEEEAFQRVKDYNATHEIGQLTERTEGWTWTGVKIQLDLKNYPIDPSSKNGAIIMSVPSMVVHMKDDVGQPFLGTEDGLTPHVGQYQLIRNDYIDYHHTGDILEYEYVFEKPNVKWTEDDILLTIINYYGIEKENKPQYTYFKYK